MFLSCPAELPESLPPRGRALCLGFMSAPGKIIMIRHGQSAANADTSIYNRVPDYRIPLTELGLEQARAAGEQVRRLLDGRQVCVYVSPYLRAYQTLEALNLGPLVARVIEEPRLREQDWGNWQDRDDVRPEAHSGTPTATSSTASPGRVRRRCLRPGRRVPGEPPPQLRDARLTRRTSCWSPTG